MKIEDRLKAIDDFFDAITIEEFEEIAINAGADDLYNTGGTERRSQQNNRQSKGTEKCGIGLRMRLRRENIYVL